MAPLMSWSDLPEELLEMILRQPTHVVNLYHYRDVCRSWRSVADKLLASSPPHLFVYEKSIECVRLFNIFTGESSSCKIPEFKTRDGQPLLPRSVYSWHGWLAMDCMTTSDHRKNHDHHIFLCNPFSRARIRLPTLTLDHSVDTHDIKFLLSSKHTSPSSINALAVRRSQFLKETLMFWKPGDEEWTPIVHPFEKPKWVADTISYKGGFCAMDFSGNVTQFELSRFPLAKEIPTRNTINNSANLFYHASSYLVESMCGDLLMVHRCFYPQEFKVYRLDSERLEWDEIRSLGDEAIFLAHNESVCMRAGESTVYRQNCIYFTDDVLLLHILRQSRRADDFGVYDMANKTIHRFPHFFLCHDVPRHRWFM